MFEYKVEIGEREAPGTNAVSISPFGVGPCRDLNFPDAALVSLRASAGLPAKRSAVVLGVVGAGFAVKVERHAELF
jgi:hypothetical protein